MPMAHPFFFLCPQCYAEESIVGRNCQRCGSAIRIDHTRISYHDQYLSAAEYSQNILSALSPEQDPADLQRRAGQLGVQLQPGMMRISGKARLWQGGRYLHFRGYKNMFTRQIEHLSPAENGYLVFYPDHLEFCSRDRIYHWAAGQFTCITTNGNAFEFKLKKQPFMQLRFISESPWKYELLLKKWLRRYYREKGVSEIVEFQPRIRFSYPRPGQKCWTKPAPGPAELQKYLPVELLAKLFRALLGIWVKVQVRGGQHWRPGQAGVVLVNHQSALDPFILGAFWDPYSAFLTKSTSFAGFIERLFLKVTSGLPTTRYQNDPQVLYLMGKFLAMGRKVGVFPEGERCWDGRLLPFKIGLVKALMASRQAIFPVVLRNTFEFWPRWSRRPRKAKLELEIKPPFSLNPHWPSVAEQKEFLEQIYKEAPAEI